MQLRQLLDQSRRLLSSLAEGRELDDLAMIVADTTGIGSMIVSATGRSVAAAGREPDDDAITELLRAAQRASVFPLTVSERTVMLVGESDDPAHAWYLVIDAPPSDLSAEAMDDFGEFASVAGLVHTREIASLPMRDRHDDLAVAELLADPSGGGAGVALVVHLSESGEDQPARLRDLVRDALGSCTESATVAVCEGEVVAHAHTDTPAALAGCLRNHLAHVDELIDGSLTLGYSPVTPESGLGGAVRSARQAARFSTGNLTVTAASELGTAAALFSFLPDHVRADFVQRVLGPLAAYDAETDAGLLSTLTQFMAHDCSWVRTAEAMNLHQNTVRYRIGRAEELTGRNLSDMNDRVDIRLALDLR